MERIHRTVLVIGGARSGKSAYAQALAERSGRAPVLIATAQIGDAEMAERIGRHRSERAEHWRTVEEPLRLAEALTAAASPANTVVVDCLTMWLTNLMLAQADIEAATRELENNLLCPGGPVVLVSNEVGQGIVPHTELGRRFRDAQGRLNQKMAATCDMVILMTAGLPHQIKPPASPDINPWII